MYPASSATLPHSSATRSVWVPSVAVSAVGGNGEPVRVVTSPVAEFPLVQPSPALRLQEALDKGAISQSEFDEVTHARQLKRNVIMVDDFDMKLEQHDAQLLQRHVF